MNHTQRAIFLGRLNASRLYTEANAAFASRTKELVADQEVIYSKLASAAKTELKGKRVDEWLVEQIGSSDKIAPPTELSDICTRCAETRLKNGADPHICNGEDFEKDQDALESGGLCIQVLFDAYQIAERIAREWYQNVDYLRERPIEFRPSAQAFKPETSYSSELPHKFGDLPVLFPANAVTAPPLKEGNPFVVRLTLAVDRVEAEYICQTVLILHHELFCHAFQFFEGLDDWPDVHDEFAEGFMNTAAHHALKSSETQIESSELPLFGCRNHSDLCNRITPMYEARDATFLGKLSKIGREAFWDLNDLCGQIDPADPTSVATEIAVRLNSTPLKPAEKLKFIITLRRVYAKLEKLGSNAREELADLFARLLDEIDSREFLSELTKLDDAWRAQSP